MIEEDVSIRGKKKKSKEGGRSSGFAFFIF